MRSDTAEFLADLYRAAEERGWTVTMIDLHGTVVLEDRKGVTTMELRGIFVSGPYLRTILAPLDPEEAP